LRHQAVDHAAERHGIRAAECDRIRVAERDRIRVAERHAIAEPHSSTRVEDLPQRSLGLLH
jgi:hypothetical protein